ncbi:MAG: flagellar motor protein MotB [Oceanospirillaceae bacterium]|nr:flagellar motor protein MotB [Oceanospirillaceae bacterium]
MSEEAEEDCPVCVPGLPAWLATFGDLMALLMCFFVLLLSFSEMDVLKFKQLAGSMREAFGVQNQIKVEDVPKGTSIIAQEFSPGRPEPTPLNEVRQMTVNNDMNTLDIRSEKGESDVLDSLQGEAERMKEEEKKEQAKKDAIQFAAVLSQEIDEGSIEIETDGKKIIIRVQEKGSFVSGSARLKDDYIPVIAKIRDLLLTIKGKISIEGHTDNIPADGKIFTSNWDLSAARALAVANEIFADVRIKQKKFEIVGRANTRPLVPNNTAANRATNRRVEIIIERGKDNEKIDRITVKEATDTASDALRSEEIF